ncbi:MAG: mechanosensitive ion channel family protein [Clostridiales bacterium]|nr:mechanosensitive ion channel family protein [Clostridiales bacterium]
MQNIKKSQIKMHRLLCYLVFLGITVVSIILYDHVFGEESWFNQAVSANDGVNMLFGLVPSVIKTVQILTIAWTLSIIARFCIRQVMRKNKRHVTIVKMINSFLRYIIAIVAILLVLSAWGVDTGALVASAGILGIVVGLGAQSLIADIIAGIFIVFERVYQVGDYVVVDGWRGRVDEIGIRTTKIVDVGGNVKVVNNSMITTVINQTKELSLARSIVSVNYGESIQNIELIIEKNIDTIKQNVPQIVEGPFYKGITNLGSSTMELLFFAKCHEEDIYTVQRGMNREIKIMFEKNNLALPYQQVVVNQPDDKQKTSLTAEQEESALKFVKSQRMFSKPIDQAQTPEHEEDIF